MAELLESLPEGFVSERSRPNWDAEVRAAAEKHGVDPDLAVALHRQEYNPKQWISKAGAHGPMQLMPNTAFDLGVNPNDPIENIDGGVRYLKQQLEYQSGNVPLALAAYNAGPGAVQKHGGIPPFEETQQYVRNVTDRYRKIKGSDSGVAYAGQPQVFDSLPSGFVLESLPEGFQPEQPQQLAPTRSGELQDKPFRPDRLTAVPENAPQWAKDHPAIYWQIADAIRKGGVESTTGLSAILSGAYAGASLGGMAGSVVPGAGTAIGGLTGAAIGSALFYAAHQYGIDAVKQYLGLEPPTTLTENIKRGITNYLPKGAAYEMGGQSVGKVVAGAAGAASRAVPWTEKGFEALESRAGNLLEESTGSSSQYAANQAEAQKIVDQIPGYEPSIGEMRNDPGLIKLQRGLQRQVGPSGDIIAQKQAQSNQALRDYLANEFQGNESIDDVLSVLNRKKTELEQVSQQSGSKVGPTIENLKNINSQEGGAIAREALKSAKAIEKGRVSQLYQDLGNPEITVSNTEKAVRAIESEFAPGEESVFPSSAINRIKRTLPKQEQPEFVTDPETGLTVAKSKSSDGVGFQDLHSLRKDLGRQIRSAEAGADPNLELSRRLRTLQDGIDADIEAGMGANNNYVQAREQYADYIGRYRKGQVGSVLRPGQEASGFKVPTGSVTKRFWSMDGADDLINAIGKDNASIIMEGHAVDQLAETGIINKITGEVNGTRLAAWINKNKFVLRKYGLTGTFENVQSVQDAFDAAQSESIAYGKSIASKMLNADPKQAIARAMEGAEGVSAKNTGLLMRNLMKQLDGNHEAIKGLKNAFKDFIIDKAETTVKDIANNEVISNANLTKTMEKYENAMKVLYADEPGKLFALQRVQKAIEISNRSRYSPSGAGSDTGENLAVQKAVAQNVLGSVLRRLPGGSITLKGIGWGLEKVEGLSAAKVNGILTRAMYDPDTAQTLMAIADGRIKTELVPSQLARAAVIAEIDRRQASKVDRQPISMGWGVPAFGVQ